MQPSQNNILDQSLGDIPAILCDKTYGLILMVNYALCRLTGFTENALITHHISMILPNFKFETSNNGTGQEEPQLVLDITGENHFVTVEAMQVMTDTDSVLLQLSIADDTSTKNSDHRFEHLLNLTKLSEEGSLEKAMGKAVPILRKLFHAGIVNIYWLDDGSPSMNRLFGYDPKKIMPRVLPASDLMMLARPMIWQKDKRDVDMTSQQPMAMNLRFLISMPLGAHEGVVGLILMGDAQSAPPAGLEKMMELARVVLNTTISHFLRAKALQREIQKITSSNQIREAVIENLKEGLLLLSSDLKIITINHAAELLLGYTRDELEDAPVDDVLIGSPILLTTWNDAQRGIASHNLGTIQLHHRGGYPFSVKLQVIPITIEKGIIHIIVIISDISEVEQITLRTQQLEHRAILGEFIAAFAHDVRNPINNISTSLQLLQRKVPKEDPNQDIISRLSEDCDRLTQLMESFLSYSRLVDSTRFEVVEIGPMVQRIVSKWKPTLENVGIEPHVSIDESLPPVSIDRRAMERVFVNLISNAVDAMNDEIENPILGVQVNLIASPSKLKQQVRVSISDNGAGIPENMRDKIFDPFTSTKVEGTGLGLSISKQIVTAHKGTITLESFPGGTVFHVLIPCMENDENEPNSLSHR